MSIKCGIDQSFTATAIVILAYDNLVDFKVFKSDKNDDIFYRCYWITNCITQFIQPFKPDLINIEGLSFGSRGDAVRQLGGLQFSIVNKLRYDLKYNVEIISPKTLKKYATGNGSSDKKLMIDKLPNNILELFTNSGYKKTTGLADLADAYWLAKI